MQAVFLLAIVAATPPPPSTVDSASLLLVPLEPVGGAVAPDVATRTTEFLAGAFSDRLEVLRAGVTTEPSAPPPQTPLQRQREAAETAERERRINDAIAARESVVRMLSSGASWSAPGEALVESLHLLARASMWAGRDRDAKAAMAEAVRMRPGHRLDATRFSRLYRRWAAVEVDRAREARRGTLVVSAAAPGASVTLDGRPLGTAPLTVTNVVEGAHLVRVKTDQGPAHVARVVVGGGQRVEHRADVGPVLGGPSVETLARHLRENRLDAATTEAARAAGRTAGAERVLAGGVARVGEGLVARTFVVHVRTGEVTRLEPVELDTELLTAEADVLRIARQAEQMSASGEASRASGRLVPTQRISPVIVEVSGLPRFPSTQPTAERARRPATLRGPLKGRDDAKIKSDECCDCTPG